MYSFSVTRGPLASEAPQRRGKVCTYVRPTDHVNCGKIEALHSGVFEYVIREIDAEIVFDNVEARPDGPVFPPVGDVFVDPENLTPFAEICLMGDGVYAVSEMRYQAATKVRCRFYEAAHEAECSLLISFESGRAVRKNGRRNLLLGYARYERTIAWLVVERIYERVYHGVAPGLVVTVTNLVKSEEQVHEVTGNPELIIVGIRVHVGCEQAPVRHNEVCTLGVRFREDAVAIHPSCRFSRSAIEVRISAAGERARGDEVWKVQVNKCHDCVLWSRCSVV